MAISSGWSSTDGAIKVEDGAGAEVASLGVQGDANKLDLEGKVAASVGLSCCTVGRKVDGGAWLQVTSVAHSVHRHWGATRSTAGEGQLGLGCRLPHQCRKAAGDHNQCRQRR